MRKSLVAFLLVWAVSLNGQTLLEGWDIDGWHIWVIPLPASYVLPQSTTIDTVKLPKTVQLSWTQPVAGETPGRTLQDIDYANARVVYVGVADVTILTSDSSGVNIESARTFDFSLSEGRYAVQVDAQDEAGNVSGLSNELYFFADKVPGVPILVRFLFQ